MSPSGRNMSYTYLHDNYVKSNAPVKVCPPLLFFFSSCLVCDRYYFYITPKCGEALTISCIMWITLIRSIAYMFVVTNREQGRWLNNNNLHVDMYFLERHIHDGIFKMFKNTKVDADYSFLRSIKSWRAKKLTKSSLKSHFWKMIKSLFSLFLCWF